MRSLVRTLGFALAAVSVAAISVAHPGHPPITPPVVSYDAGKAAPFELFRGQRIFLQGKVNSHATTMMLDSGAGMTVVDSAYAKQISLPTGTEMMVRGANGDVPGHLVTGVKLEAGSLVLDNLTVLVMDMSESARAIGRPIPVILGRDAFKAGIVAIDFPHQRISFADRSTYTPPTNAQRLSVADGGPIARVKLSVAGLPPVDADVDLGNGGTVVLGNGYWTKQPALATLRSARSEISGIGGSKPARRATLPVVQLGGLRFANVPATFNEDPQTLPRDGANIGTEMFKPFVAVFDYGGGAIYLRGPSEVTDLPRDRTGIRAELRGDHLQVVYVSPDGPAATAGLKAGDQIVAVNGRKVAADYFARPDWTIAPAGTDVTVTRADGSKVHFKLADYY